ncbi:MAG: coenzyme F420-0:L-glutamate ligase [Actinomycetes bacterium]|jgi:coenzyme F420-0:L-glutamate ligase/coenzyme F420-1:gamma-L-glutamate ligase
MVVPLAGLPEVRPGDDLARLLLEAVKAAGLELADGDVLAVTSKVVAKAEGRLLPLPADPAASERARREAVAAETVRVVARRGRLVIAETRQGLVGANALVDASNAGGDALVLLPRDPDASAARLRAAIQALDGHDVAVVVTDTLGRPWRLGQTDVAVGLAGMGALEDWRGRPDGDGRILEVTEVAVADEVAAAADLVKGKASRVPAALLRGVPRPTGDGSARDLVRSPADDLFRTAGTVEDLLAVLEGGPPPTRFLPGPVDPAALDRAVATADAVPLAAGRRLRVLSVPAAARGRCVAALSPTGPPDPALEGAPLLLAPCLAPPPAAAAAHSAVLVRPAGKVGGHRPGAGAGAAPPDDLGVALAAGGAVRTLQLALHVQGIGSSFQPAGPDAWAALAAALELAASWRPLGLLAAGRPG